MLEISKQSPLLDLPFETLKKKFGHYLGKIGILVSVNPAGPGNSKIFYTSDPALCDSLVNLVVNYVTVRNTSEQCRDPISREQRSVHGPEGRNEAIKLAGSVCGYCRQNNLSKRSVHLERFGDGKLRRLFLKFWMIHVAEVTSDGALRGIRNLKP